MILLSHLKTRIFYSDIFQVLSKRNPATHIVGGASNHIHIVTHIHPAVCPAYLIKDIKEACHALMCRERALFNSFLGWQVGYSGFTYHISSKSTLINYVKNQAEHHKTVTYKDELIQLLNEHFVQYNEEYLFK